MPKEKSSSSCEANPKKRCLPLYIRAEADAFVASLVGGFLQGPRFPMNPSTWKKDPQEFPKKESKLAHMRDALTLIEEYDINVTRSTDRRVRA